MTPDSLCMLNKLMKVKHQKGDTTMVAESEVGVVRLYYSVLLTQSTASSV